MTSKLTTLVQDNYGRYHRPGECVEVVGQVRELDGRAIPDARAERSRRDGAERSPKAAGAVSCIVSTADARAGS
jgi:hypothetical protein